METVEADSFEDTNKTSPTPGAYIIISEYILTE